MPSTGTLPLLDPAPPGYEYAFHMTLVRGKAKIIVVVEPEPDVMEALLDSAGLNIGHGLLGTIVAMLILWTRIKEFIPKRWRRDGE